MTEGTRGREVFLVSNSVDEMGGVTSWSHQMARLFTERGHRVHVIGVTTPENPHDLGELPYPTTRLYDGQPPAPGRARDASMRAKARNSGNNPASAARESKSSACCATAMCISTRAGPWQAIVPCWGMKRR